MEFYFLLKKIIWNKIKSLPISTWERDMNEKLLAAKLEGWGV